MSEALRLCWWEVDELCDHMRSRSDLWTQSNENESLWLREDPRVPAQAFALLIVPPKDGTSRFRTSLLQPLALSWDDAYIESYLTWLLQHWTSYQQRVIVTKFLIDELGVPAETAGLAAIAIGGLSWEEDAPPVPAEQPLQEELWPEAAPPPPAFSFESDPTLVGTFLLAGSDGWIQLRLLGGMLRATLSLRSRDGAHVLPLQGLVRPLNGRTRDAAAEIAGWPDETVDEVSLVTEDQADFLLQRPPSTIPFIQTENHE